MKTECDTLAVWLWKNESTALIRDRGWQGVAARLAREFAAHARVLDSVDSIDSSAQRSVLLSGLVERQPLIGLMMRDLFDVLNCGCATYPAPWSQTYTEERRSDCRTWNAARLAHHLRVLSHGFETMPQSVGGDVSKCNCLEDSIRRHPIYVVEVLERLSSAAADDLQRGAHGKA